MSFRANSYQQIAFTDCMNGLTAEEQKKHCNILGQKLLWKMFFLLLMKNHFLFYIRRSHMTEVTCSSVALSDKAKYRQIRLWLRICTVRRFFPCRIWQVPTTQVVRCISACVYAILKSSISENSSLKSAYTHEILRFTEGTFASNKDLSVAGRGFKSSRIKYLAPIL